MLKDIKALKPVDPKLLENFLKHMREEGIPEIIKAVRAREEAANEMRSKNVPLY